ncbi:MAG: hypothetical protein M3Z08_11945 [Chloroflexota bacterium]|nr:hypothetical protein [Chloroflexota bacterium]
MSKSVFTRPRSSKRLTWLILPLLLLAVLISGGFSLSRSNAAHAAATLSPLNGRYIFHAITLDGPQAGLSIHGSLALTSLQEGVVGRVGTLCLSTLDPRGCALVTGSTPDNVNVTLTVHSTTNFPTIDLTGTFDHGISEHGAIRGTFSFGYGAHQSVGDWVAHVAGRVPTVDGGWHISGRVTTGPDTGHIFFRATLALVQTSSNSLVGIYCPERHGAACIPVLGENRSGYVFLYVGDPVMFKFRGTFRSMNQLLGNVEVFNSADRGVWSAERIA